jgi:cytochrome c556
MRRFAALAVLISLSLSLVAGIVLAQRASNAGRKKGPPTSFDPRVEDAFFADVLKAHGKGTLEDALKSGGPAAGQPKTVESDGGGGGEAGWAKVISADTLESEIKTAINEAGPHVDSKTKWATGHRKVRALYSTMAVCFAVIAKYDGEVKYKKSALALRDGLSRAAANAKVNSDQALQEAKARLNDLIQVRNGGGGPAADNADPKAPFKAIVDVSEAMKRMASAHEEGECLKVWIAAADGFKSKKAQIVHQAEMLGMLAKVLQDPSYEYPDEFGQIAKGVQTAAEEIVQAVKADNHQAAQTAVGKITNACTNCHGKFRD